MKKWPQKWIEVATFEYLSGSLKDEHGQRILDALDAVGALRPLPKPKERWVCEWCGFSTEITEGYQDRGKPACHGYTEDNMCTHTKMRLYREVEDSDDR